ncbi:hypothetical protein J2805_004286 [Arthrobacter oryzae]|nr:hypothetical protein [Arthrobacter oryzae]
MSAPTVDAAINDLLDWAWHAVYDLLAARALLGEGLNVGEYAGMSSRVEGPTRYTVVLPGSGYPFRRPARFDSQTIQLSPGEGLTAVGV